jgi:F-type H+-transporting ATPase subunit epsilon
LADTVVRATDLDEAAAIMAHENAQRLLADKKSNMDFSLILSQLAQATAQLRTLKLIHKKTTKD